MKILALLAGFCLIVLALADMCETVLIPRTATRQLRMTRLFYRITWGWSTGLASRLPGKGALDLVRIAYGPLSLLLLLGLWAAFLVTGFACLYWGAGLSIHTPGGHVHIGTILYFSGTTFFTLGFGDVLPGDSFTRILAVIEAGVGFAFLAIVIGYLPVIYSAFSRRELGISLLDSRAGSPPSGVELLCRYSRAGRMESLASLLADFERWAADVLESHLSYPVVAYYRSQHDRESWLAAILAILDACALLRLGFQEEAPWQAELMWQAHHTFAMCRHTAIDLSLIFVSNPHRECDGRLSPEGLLEVRKSLAAAGIRLSEGPDADALLKKLRREYEPFLFALATRLLVDLPPWLATTTRKDNWQTSAWDMDDHF